MKVNREKLNKFLREQAYVRIYNSLKRQEEENSVVSLTHNVDKPTKIFLDAMTSDVKMMYDEVTEILHSEIDNRPEIINTVETINFGEIGYKQVNCREHTIRIRYNNYNFAISEIINMPNTVIVFRIKDLEINNPIYIATFKEILGKRNYYSHQMSDMVHYGQFLKSSPEALSIDVYAINGTICKSSFYSCFFHEFSHLYQDYEQLLNENIYENIKQYRIAETIKLIKNDNNFSEDDKKHLTNILKNILNNTEIHAYAAGHFGELLGKNITPNEYEEFTKISNVWIHIHNLKNSIKHVLEFNDEKNLLLFKIIKNAKIDEFFSSSFTLEVNFKHLLKMTIVKRLQKLINMTVKNAAYYFGGGNRFKFKKMS